MNEHVLQLKNISLALAGRELFALSAEIRAGEVLTVMGPSGAGKSSLLAYIAGFLAPAFTASGGIELDGVEIGHLPAEQRHMGLLFQDPLLFPHLSVGGNLHFALPRDTQNAATVIAERLREMGLEGYAHRDPHTLSGGQKSRVALLRLLLSKPHAVLLDEPFSRLDTHLRRDVRSLVFDNLRAAGLPALMVTHDAEDAEAAGGPVIQLSF